MLDSWLELPLVGPGSDDTLRATLHKAAGEDAKRPVHECELAIRRVEAVERAPEYSLPISSGITYDARRRIVALDDELLVRVTELDVELSVTATVVGWELVREGRIGPISYERVIPLPDG